jgi:pimeloyl-ACP methyl ester carboxylesterase
MADGATQIILPQQIDIEDALEHDTFSHQGEFGAVWFERRGPILLVPFDNLATLDEPYPRLPWLHKRAEDLGYSLLGVQSFAKDWFRNPTAPDLLRRLVKIGFFDQFEKILFVGASMGAFGALNFAPLVPRARVLAFSPQSTMNRTIVPFDSRFPYAVRRTNWEGQPFLDAAAAVPYIPKVAILFDPFVPEDKAHAMRLNGPNVQLLKAGHYTHEAIRVVIKSDALHAMIREFIETDQIGLEFWRNMRARRSLRKWKRALVDSLVKKDHPKLTLRACNILLKEEQFFFAHRARKEVLAAHPELEKGS